MRNADSFRHRLAKSRLMVEVLEERTLLSVAHPQIMDASSTDYDPATILVQFRDHTNAPVSGSQILPGTEVGPALAPLLVPGLYEVRLTDGVSVPQAMAAYNASALVEYAEPNFHVYTTDTIPDDSLWSNSGLNGIRRIRMPLSWDAWQGSGGTIVASIDTGVDYNHPDLAGNMWWGIGQTFVSGTTTPLDDNGHGSHTAGIMAASGNNGYGVVGVNWYAQIMALKVLNSGGSGSTSSIISALNYAVNNGAAVSNNSYGCLGCYSASFYNAIVNADAYGHIFVAAAGNSNRNNDTSAFYPANYNSGNVISVAATNRDNDSRASYSNYGPNTVHIAAPGSNILSTYSRGRFATSSGTSMAAPFVAGAAALIVDYFGLWGTPADIRQYLMDTSDYVGLPIISGGRLNVARAIGTLAPGPDGSSGGDLGDPLVTRALAEVVSGTFAVSPTVVSPTGSEQPAALDLFAIHAIQQQPESGIVPAAERAAEDAFSWEVADVWKW